MELEKAGLVEVLMHEPKEFHAISIEKCVFDLLNKRILKTAELQRRVSKLTLDFKRDTVDEEPEEKFQFILISNKNAVYAKSEKMMANLNEQICFLALRRRMITWLYVCLPLLEAALARKVECKMILPKIEPGVDIGKSIKSLKSHPNFTLKFISEEPKFGFSIWDNKEILLTTLPIDSPIPAPTLWSSNRGLVDLCQEHFDCIWNRAGKVMS